MSLPQPQGTRFLVFPEFPTGYLEPETVYVASPPGSIGAGPQDERFYVADAVLKPRPYDPPDYLPPYRGTEFPPVLPGPGGHFDHYGVDAPQFRAAHLYGAARHTLDVWERYFGHRIEWWHAPGIPRLELVPLLDWANAHSGPGFLETGVARTKNDLRALFCMNFDVIAHEVGHAIIFSQLGVPSQDQLHDQYLAFHESFSDLVALVGTLNFPTAVNKLLQQTGGNLYVLNIVSRIGAYSDTEQIRVASNTTTMDDVRGLRRGPDGEWIDPLGQKRNQHQLGEPLTGAIFDCLVEIYQDRLVSLGLIPPDLDARGWSREEVAQSAEIVARAHGRALERFIMGFHQAIAEARDVIGVAMAHTLRTLHPDTLNFERVAACMLEGAHALGEASNVPGMLAQFVKRGLDPRPFLINAFEPGEPPALKFHDPWTDPRAPRTGDPTAFIFARKHMTHPHREEP
jgi:hypothetical protein